MSAAARSGRRRPPSRTRDGPAMMLSSSTSSSWRAGSAGSAGPGRRYRRPGWPRTGGSGGRPASGRAAGEHRGGTPCRPSGRPRRYHDLDGVETDAPPFDEIAEPAGTGHGHVDAPGQGLQLRAVAHAAVEARPPEVRGSRPASAISVATWAHSSRVGVRTRTRGCPGRDDLPFRRATAPMPKARVFPDPVGPCRRRRGRPRRRAWSWPEWGTGW